jgi:hypothetical protein
VCGSIPIPGMTRTASTPEVDDLVRIAQVRADFESGEAQRELDDFPIDEEELSRAIGAAGNLVGRWRRRERRPSGTFAVRYSRVVETLRRTVQ